MHCIGRVVAEKKDVEAFLDEVRKAIREKRALFDGRKEKNQKTLLKLGYYSTDCVYNDLLELTYDDYWYGPEPDDRQGHTEDVWFFKKTIFGMRIYIKMEFVSVGGKTLFVMSFHEENM